LRVGFEEAYLRQIDGPASRQIQERSSDIDPDNAPSHTDTLGQLQGGLSCTAANIDHRVTQRRTQRVHCTHP
jgi:hypothetical protein